MGADISSAFIAQYVAEVHQAYQRQGSLLRNMIRLKSGVTGSTAIFQKTGTGVAGKKTRHGDLPVMDVTHTPVTATLEDWYGPAYSDKLDELKTNIDERMVLANAGAWALGRKADSLIITALDGTTVEDTAGTLGLSRDRCLTAIEKLNAADVPDDGQRFAIVGAHQWSELMCIKEFASRDYVGEAYPWLKGTEARSWRNVTWMMHSGLPLASVGGVRKCYMFHKNAIGLAEGAGVQTEINYVPTKSAWLFNSYMSMGSVLIDTNGIIEIQCDDDHAFAA